MAADETTRKRALLLDDNLMFTMAVEGALRRLGFGVQTLPPSLGALDRVPAPPALILLNVTGAGGQRLDLLRQLRARPELADTKLLAYTGHTDTETFHAAKEAGADLVVANSSVMGHLETVLRKAGWV